MIEADVLVLGGGLAATWARAGSLSPQETSP